MRFFYDTEFLADGRAIEFLSLGVVAEDGREYYAINGEFNGAAWHRLMQDQWMVDNVLPSIPTTEGVLTKILDRDHTDVKPLHTIKSELLQFFGYKHYATDDKSSVREQDVELWANFAAYDHVVYSQLWGKMIDLPRGMPMYTNDIQQAYRAFNRGSFLQTSQKMLPPTQTEGLHNALADARHVKVSYDHLAQFTRQI